MPQTLLALLACTACGAPQGRALESSSASQTVPDDASFRVGVVRMREVLATSQPGRDAQETFETEVRGLQARMDAMREQVEEAAAKVEEARARRVPSRRMARLANDYQERLVESQQLEAQLQVEYEARQRAATEPVLESARQIAARLGQQEGLSIILDARSTPFFGAETDLTERVIAELDEAAAQAAIEAELSESGEPREGSADASAPAFPASPDSGLQLR